MKKTMLASFSLKTSTLFPLALVLIILISIFVYVDVYNKGQFTQKYIDKELLVAKTAMDSSIKSNKEKLAIALTIITSDFALKEAMVSGDREALLEQSSRYFKTLREKNDITHLYFHQTNRVNFLRIHNPKRYGDKIDRFSILQAEATHRPASAIELGPLGLFTLRVVFPWYENEKLIGYVEMGQEIEHIYTHIKKIANVDLYVNLDKKVLTKEGWEEGMKLMGRKAEWNRSVQFVEVFTTLAKNKQALIKYITDCDLTKQVDMKFLVDEHTYQVSSLPLMDPNLTNNRKLGCIFLIHDTSSAQQEKTEYIFLAVGGGILLGSLLILLFYFIIRRTGNKLHQQEELMISQSRQAAMGDMISMIAHQWRQPLSVVAMAINNIKVDIRFDEKISNEQIEEMGDDILVQTAHLSKTIDDFSNFFKPNKEKVLTLVSSVIESALEMVGKSLANKNIALKITMDCRSEILTYPNELLQVFLNIINNAKDALTDAKIGDAQINITISEDKELVSVVICDNGGGIPLKVLEHLGEPYVSSKSKNGTGLGIYMSKIIVEKHLLGEISWENRGSGACFTITLPLKSDEIL